MTTTLAAAADPLRFHRALLEPRGVAAAAAQPPALAGTSTATRPMSSSTASPPLELAEVRDVDALRADRRAREHPCPGRHRSGRSRARPRARAPVQEARLAQRWCGTLWPTPALAQQAGMSERRLRGVRAPGAVPRPPRPGRGVARAERAPGALVERLGERARDPDRGRRHRPAPARRGPHLDQLRRPAQHAERRGLHRPARATRPTARSASTSHRARAAPRSTGVELTFERRPGRERHAPSAASDYLDAALGHRRRRALPRRARDRHQHRDRPADRLDPARREDRRHRPPRARPLVPGDRRRSTSRRCTGI